MMDKQIITAVTTVIGLTNSNRFRGFIPMFLVHNTEKNKKIDEYETMVRRTISGFCRQI